MPGAGLIELRDIGAVETRRFGPVFDCSAIGELTDSLRTEVCKRCAESALARQAIIGEPVPVKKPSPGALLLGLIPFAAMCLSVALWDRLDPMILGIPFNLFWLICWIVLSTFCMWAAYRVEAARDKKDGGNQ